ncbi:MAG: hypothetical protein FE78DRAFT_29293 [Acidomyces sp. 'richmondensis']|nr:MAG: hypothetical protein FE78DRAFT_29293 [Acidomyces sp. 'richmondensis']
MRNNVIELTKWSFLPLGSKYYLLVLRSKDLFKLSNGGCAKVVVLIRIVSSTVNFRYIISIYAIKNSLADKVYNLKHLIVVTSTIANKEADLARYFVLVEDFKKIVLLLFTTLTAKGIIERKQHYPRLTVTINLIRYYPKIIDLSTALLSIEADSNTALNIREAYSDL